MIKLKKIDVMSLAKNLTLIYLIVGVIMAIAIVAGLFFPEIVAEMDVNVINLGYWNLIVIPLTYAIGGFLTGIFGGLIYNMVAKKTGGIAVDLSDKKK